MWEILCNSKTSVDYKWVECELLHEFMEKYQVKYLDPFTDQEEERLVQREQVRAAHDRRMD